MRVYSGKQRQPGRVSFYRMSSRVRERLFGCPIVSFTWFLGLWIQAEKLSVVTKISFFIVKTAHTRGSVVYFLRCESITKKARQREEAFHVINESCCLWGECRTDSEHTETIFLLSLRTASVLETLLCSPLLRQHSKPPLPRNCGVKGPCFFSSLISLYNV